MRSRGCGGKRTGGALEREDEALEVEMDLDLFDLILCDGRLAPYHGWHDDHRSLDGTPEYRPAAQQVRSEFMEFAQMLRLGVLSAPVPPNARGDSRHFCLQLGLGVPGGTHLLLQTMFGHVRSVDNDRGTIDQFLHRFPDVRGGVFWGDTRSAYTYQMCASMPPVDLLFIDAGHRYEEVLADHNTYAHLVRSGGVVAFHDAVRRPQFGDEIGVWRVLDDLRDAGFDVKVIGTEVGIAYYVVP